MIPTKVIFRKPSHCKYLTVNKWYEILKSDKDGGWILNDNEMETYISFKGISCHIGQKWEISFEEEKQMDIRKMLEPNMTVELRNGSKYLVKKDQKLFQGRPYLEEIGCKLEENGMNLSHKIDILSHYNSRGFYLLCKGKGNGLDIVKISVTRNEWGASISKEILLTDIPDKLWELNIGDKVQLKESWGSDVDVIKEIDIFDKVYSLKAKDHGWLKLLQIADTLKEEEKEEKEEKVGFTKALEQIKGCEVGEYFICDKSNLKIIRLTQSKVVIAKGDKYLFSLVIQEEERDKEVLENVQRFRKVANRVEEKPEKTRRRVFKVEHKVDGKLYDFREPKEWNDRTILSGKLVVCNTKYGKTYGIIKAIDYKALMTDEEYNKLSVIEERV